MGGSGNTLSILGENIEFIFFFLPVLLPEDPVDFVEAVQKTHKAAEPLCSGHRASPHPFSVSAKTRRS